MTKLLLFFRAVARSCGTTRLRLACALAGSVLAFGTGALGASFTASLDRDTVTLGESLTLSLTFSGGAPENPPALPAIRNLQIDYVGPSSQFSFINGQVSSTVTHNFTVTPRQAGEFTIPAVTAEVAGAKLATQPLKLKVLAPNAPPPAAVAAGNEPAFMKLVLPRKEIYMGDTMLAELQLYVRSGVRFGRLQLTGFPADGFNVGKMAEGQRRQMQVGNAIYTVIPVSIALNPVKTGALNLGPVTATLVIEVPSSNRRRDIFDPFGMFGNTEEKQVSLATETEALRALPLPTQNSPPNFNGAVGSYSLSVTAGPTNVAAGDPITVRVQISGRGALDALTLPAQAGWEDFKTYPPTTKVETSDGFGLQGTKTFEEVVVPQSAEVNALPPISFSFFDPDQKAYRTVTQPALPLVVRPSASAQAPVVTQGGRRQDTPPPAQDIVDIKQHLGAMVPVGPPLVQQPWFLAVQSVPVLAWISTLVWRRRVESLANNPRLRRRRQVAQILREGLVELRRLATENQSDAFFATLFRLLQEQLGERLDLPASAITEAVIEEHLRPRGGAEPTWAPLQELFQTCNLARYAPFKSSQELAAIITKFEAVSHQLQSLEL
ncbi:conserved exported hypothetical protein [Verrucomicrobia bacterium]|nr:conserved exported hypothetical protein [Verrucomicrobiota bacterium]